MSSAAELDPQVADLRDAAIALGRPPLASLSPAEARERTRAGDRLCASGPPVAVRETRIASVPVRVYSSGGPARATVAYAHGGGWVTGDLLTGDEVCRHLAVHAQVDVVSIDYRLAPEHPFPAGLEDVRAVLERLEGPVVAAGDSAGANLALAAVMTGEPGTATALALVHPVLDARRTSASHHEHDDAFPVGSAELTWFLDHYAHGIALTDVRLSPGLGPVTDLPPTLVVAVGHDPLHDEAVEFTERLARAGVPCRLMDLPEMCHGFLRLTGASPGAAARRDDVVAAVARLVAEVAPQALHQ